MSTEDVRVNQNPEVDTEEIALYIAYINNKLVQIHGNLQLVQEEEIIQLRKTA